MDLGTGDGRLPCVRARLEPDRLFIGIDANAAGLRERSNRAAREQANVVFVRAAVEAHPRELQGIADELTVVLPWGSLLSAVARPDVEILRAIRALCRPGAALTVVLAVDAERDRTEIARLGLPPLDLGCESGELAAGYAAAGFRLDRVRRLDPLGLASWPSTWAKRLASSGARSAIQLDARAVAGCAALEPV